MHKDNSMPRASLNFVLKPKVRYFRFLFDKGFKVSNFSSLLESLGSWFVEFESDSGFIVILSDRDEIMVRIYPVKLDRSVVVGLKPMIYYLTNGQTFLGSQNRNLVRESKKQIEEISGLLKKYIDRIIPYFGKGYKNYESGIMEAQKKYIELQLANYE